ncbi:MAG: HEPN domain-containing protein [SAR202 cluster bacterium]|nr:HEPN domain-containing protein [SAR202 cluster bacterium]
MTPDRRSEGERWLRQAERDIDDAQFAKEGQRYSLSCFLAQQAGEKAVKGYLYYRGAEAVWGHALADLCEDAKAFEMLFDTIKSRAIFLDKYYNLTRYPNYLPGGIPADVFDDLEAGRALELAADVIAFVQERLAEAKAEGL